MSFIGPFLDSVSLFLYLLVESAVSLPSCHSTFYFSKRIWLLSAAILRFFNHSEGHRLYPELHLRFFLLLDSQR